MLRKYTDKYTYRKVHIWFSIFFFTLSSLFIGIHYKKNSEKNAENDRVPNYKAGLTPSIIEVVENAIIWFELQSTVQ